MLLVKTTLRPSEVHGLGLFADEFIPKGTVIWRFDGRVDIHYDESQLAKRLLKSLTRTSETQTMPVGCLVPGIPYHRSP